MTLDSYRNFVTIVDCGSIVAAANKLLIAQPSLSNQLKNIEKTYGAKLLRMQEESFINARKRFA